MLTIISNNMPTTLCDKMPQQLQTPISVAQSVLNDEMSELESEVAISMADDVPMFEHAQSVHDEPEVADLVTIKGDGEGEEEEEVATPKTKKSWNSRKKKKRRSTKRCDTSALI